MFIWLIESPIFFWREFKMKLAVFIIKLSALALAFVAGFVELFFDFTRGMLIIAIAVYLVARILQKTEFPLVKPSDKPKPPKPVRPPKPVYAPQQPYAPQQAYAPQPPYAPQQAYAPQQTVPQQAAPQQAVPQQAAPQQNMTPQA